MKQRDPRLFIEDILLSISAIERYVSDLSKEEFAEQDLIQDAVVRRLEIIGEAARQLPTELRDLYPDIPWRRIAGLRNRLTHEYFGIVVDRVWNVVQDDLPTLKTKIEDIQSRLADR